MSIFAPKTAADKDAKTLPNAQRDNACDPKNGDGGSALGSLWMLVSAVFFTTMGVLVKRAGDKFAMHEYELVFWRVSFAVVVLGALALARGRSFATAYPKAHFWRSLAGSVGLFTFFFGLVHLPLATAVTFNYTSSLFLAIFSVVLLKQKPTARVWFALALGLFGIALILRPSLIGHGLLPSLVGLSSGAIAGYAYLQVRQLSLLGEPSWRIVFYFSVLASVLSALASSVKGWSGIDGQRLPYLLAIGATATVAQLAMTYAYQVGRKFTVSALAYSVVVFSTLYGVVFLGEKLTALSVCGIAFVIASGVLASKK